MSTRIKTDPAINPAVKIKDQQEREQHADAPYHIHPWGVTGASNCDGCDIIKAGKILRLIFPPPQGEQKNEDAFYHGTLHHNDCQRHGVNAYKNDPVNQYHAEVRVRVKIVDGLIVVTPMDEIVTAREPNPIQIISTEFAPGDFREVAFFTPEAVIKWLGDIKTAGGWAFKHTLDFGLSKGYQYQGMIELKATNMDKMTFRVINKEKGAVFTIDLYWDQAVWDELVQISERFVSFRDMLRDLLKETDEKEMVTLIPTIMPHVARENCRCYHGDTIAWRSCTLAKVETTIDARTKLPRLDLMEPCPFLKKFIYEDYLTLFPIGEWRKYGRSGVKILDNNVVDELGRILIKFISRADLTKLETKIAAEEKKFTKYQENLLKFKKDHDEWVEYKKDKPKGKKKEPQPPEKVDLKTAQEIKLEFEQSGQIVFLDPVEAWVQLKEFPPKPEEVPWPTNQSRPVMLNEIYLPEGSCGRCTTFEECRKMNPALSKEDKEFCESYSDKYE